MFTNVQILTQDEQIVQVRVEPDKKITAAYQDLRKVPYTLIDVYGHWVEILDLSHNRLREVDDLATAFALHTLILDHNLINGDIVFPFMPHLKALWLNNNLISQLQDFIPSLCRACPNLVYLSLLGNRASTCTAMGQSQVEQDRYRQYVISHFEHLRHLDDRPVTAIERLQSDTRGNSTFMDNLSTFYQEVRSTFRFYLKKKTNNGVV